MQKILLMLLIAIYAAQGPVKIAAAASSPESEMAFELCKQSYSAQTYYSCQCIADNIGPYVDKTAASEVEESKKMFLYHYGENGKKAFDNIDKSNLTPEQKAERKQQLQTRMNEDKQQIANLQDKSAWDDRTLERLVNSASLQAYKDPACKVGETLRKEEFERCERTSTMKKVDCGCYADTTAKLWTTSDRSYSSKAKSYFMGQARIQCRN